jgi:hypothetical protein
LGDVRQLVQERFREAGAPEKGARRVDGVLQKTGELAAAVVLEAVDAPGRDALREVSGWTRRDEFRGLQTESRQLSRTRAET